MEKIISFLVPCYNSESYMEKCIESLLPAGEDIEILIVNDGSTDRTGEIADSYAAKYPTICKALHQENGGHGEGINHGMRVATGKYFKVLDSDDWADEAALPKVVEILKDCETKGGIDLLVCPYKYDRPNPKENYTIKYNNVFPANKIIGWSDTHSFYMWQYLTLHSCFFRTQILRDTGIILPKKIFYEDNLFVYLPLPAIERIYYYPEVFYHYFIGREDQSVQEESMKKRCTHQIMVSKAIFKAYNLREIKKKNKRLAKYMYHEVVFMMGLATIFTRLNRTDEAEQMVEEMWQEMYAFDKRLARRIRRASITLWLNLPGKAGRKVGFFCYRASHVLVPFN